LSIVQIVTGNLSQTSYNQSQNLDAIATHNDNETGMSDNDSVSTTAKYLIGAVTKLTGLSIDVVRVWERRYGAVRPTRSAGGTRLYSDADVLRLNRLRRAVEAGFGIGPASRLSETELDELLTGAQPAPDQADPYQSTRQRFIAAIRSMDVVAADQELARAATLLPPTELLKRIVSPLFEELRSRKALKEFGLAHERVATGLLRRMLESLIRLYPPSGTADTMILAAPVGDDHEFDLLFTALLGAVNGWRVVYLGSGVPASEIALTVQLTNARVLTLNVSTESYRIDEELESISRAVSGSTQVWVTGAAAPRQKAHIGRVNWTPVLDLEDLDARLKR
jgi:MerR family transcriptional regulator, light-induced transcriptional regulator